MLRYIPGILIFLLLPSLLMGQNYLSDLSARADDPLYTTYAAPMHRSQFVLDEGYQFRFYEALNGIDFETDNAGEIGWAFKLDGRIRYYREQMEREPEIATSYPDILQYRYEPFAGVEVEVTFQVYSSRKALQDVRVINRRDSAITIDAYPFLHHEGGLHSISAASGRDHFTFGHREPPDGWTRSHDVPFVEDVKNLLLMSRVPASIGSYAGLGSPTRQTGYNQPDSDHLPDQNYAVEYGRVYNADGSGNTKTPPQVRQLVLLNGSGEEILTEMAPKWGDADPNIPGNGWQGAELGNFQHPEIKEGDSFTVLFTDLVTGQRGSIAGDIPALPVEGGINVGEMHLSDQTYPAVPGGFEVSFSENESSADINWQADDGLTYDLYRRTDARKGRFGRIAEGLTVGNYGDFNLTPDSTYMYTLIARDSTGRRSPHTQPRGERIQTDLFTDMQGDTLASHVTNGKGNVTAFQYRWTLQAGQSQSVRLIRAVEEAGTETDTMLTASRDLLTYDWSPDITRNEQLYQSIPPSPSDHPDEKMMYWSAYTLMRQVFYPPANLSSYNYYVFSREPTWGWGHGGQVFHESLAMLAYVFMDGESAQNSQRVYMERQHENGYIDYRSGGYLSEQIPSNGELTTSAPWFSWENWMIYRETKDDKFLEEAYQSGEKFYDFWLENRDKDGDELMEWGGVAFLEAVRDGQVAAWQVGAPENFEALALNTMLVKEARSIARMAEAMGDTGSAENWNNRADSMSRRINETFWDEQTGFYYMVDRDDHDFTFNDHNDLKRQEIIGFLPLWSETATQEQADKLVETLTDTDKFWREHGVPSLAADDPYYNHAGYWNGPVWVQWEYLIFRGLLNYGYDELARELAQKVFDKVIFHLKRDHTFWEMYSPDTDWAGHHQTYIWTGIVARMMIDLEREATGIGDNSNKARDELPRRVKLKPNTPNPFNPGTTLRYELPAAQEVTMEVYNLLGQKVATILNEEKRSAGLHREYFDADGLASGIYIYQLKTPGGVFSEKMTLIQ